MKIKILSAAAGFCLALTGSHVPAAITYSYETDAAVYDVSSGSATVNIYLHETLTDGSTSLLATENGLLGYGFSVVRSSGDGAYFSAITSNTAAFGGLVSPHLTTGSASLSDNVPLTSANGPVPDGSGLIFLGRITLALNETGSAPTSFTLRRDNDLGGNTGTFTNFYDIDFDSVEPEFAGATGSATFTVVPEPTAITLLALGGMGILRRRRRGANPVCC